MFADALKAMAEGETEAEKQIVYVLNEARAALPCPSFAAMGHDRSRSLYVFVGGKPTWLVHVEIVTGGFEVTPSPTVASGTLALADAVIQSLRESHAVIMQAAAEAGQMAPLVSRVGGISVADALAGFERLRNVASGPSATENDPKALRAAMSRAFEEIRGMRKEFGNPDSDYGAGAKEACDRIAAALVIAE